MEVGGHFSFERRFVDQAFACVLWGMLVYSRIKKLLICSVTHTPEGAGECVTYKNPRRSGILA